MLVVIDRSIDHRMEAIVESIALLTLARMDGWIDCRSHIAEASRIDSIRSPCENSIAFVDHDPAIASRLAEPR
jgi:hypothetical protein